MIKDMSTEEATNTAAAAIHQVAQAVKVKGAVLLKVDNKHVLMHYNTIIFEVVDNTEVILCTAKTASSNRAVQQALRYLGSSKTVKQIKAELNGNNGKVCI